MKKLLCDIADIRLGYSFRGAIPFDVDGDYFVAQVRDIDDMTQAVLTEHLTQISFDGNVDALLQDQDILLSTRGTESSGLKVGIYDGQEEYIIAASSLYVLRITDTNVLPRYVLYYLNSFYGQRALKNMMSGATIKTIAKKDLSEIMIPIPPIPTQHTIVEAMLNITKQKILLQQKMNVLGTLTDNIISIHQ